MHFNVAMKMAEAASREITALMNNHAIKKAGNDYERCLHVGCLWEMPL